VNRSHFEVVTFRFAFAALIGFLGAIVQPFALPLASSALLGVVVALLTMLLAARLRRADPQHLIVGCLGATTGLCVALLLVYIFAQAGFAQGSNGQFLRIALPLAAGYIGLVAGLANAESLPFGLVASSKTASSSQTTKILDTSVLIDGRIVDIAESGFMEGRLIVPRFVLHELQLVADSSDSAKRNRGRRGLDVVQLLQKQPRIRLEVSSEDFPETREVDLKLIELAKRLQAKIVTNDFNLNKVAQLHGVQVLNINDLANALKPVVLPGELMRVFILKEGKEYNQGVAYLDDGTMVVVDNARKMISKTIDVAVTSVLQTTAGKMIFGRFDERTHAVHDKDRPPAREHAAPAAGA